ncbi:uncharacterized protein DFL_006095 [Arthrobotrys flagrans]|uniref:Caffeine-induced death protein Cid2 n=1 Tax=Arthrobotrys flagrans TaxID=97331 RepID=A0A437A053_ARTFL|nr:hypothetical protein DFL_006095 [Arthrobotrys flagrans]
MWKTPPRDHSSAEPQHPSSPMTSSNDPLLTPQFCFSTSTLKEFLRLSRSTTDDTISQHLSSLSPPPTFKPSTTSQRTPSHRLIPPSTLSAFLSSTIYPTWSKRSEILTYCAIVATSPDPNDPNLEVISKETEAERMRIVDERLDPYSGRFFPTETRTQVLAGVVRNERGVEDIVRERTWEVIKDRSTDGMGGKTWKEAYEEWKTSS